MKHNCASHGSKIRGRGVGNARKNRLWQTGRADFSLTRHALHFLDSRMRANDNRGTTSEKRARAAFRAIAASSTLILQTEHHPHPRLEHFSLEPFGHLHEGLGPRNRDARLLVEYLVPG